MRLLLRPFLGQNNDSQRPDNRVLHAWTSTPFCPLCHIALVSAFRSLVNLTSHTLCRSLGRTENCWKTRCVCSYLVICCNMSPCCVRAMGVCRALALFGDTKQAMGEGKSGPVETGLTALRSEKWSSQCRPRPFYSHPRQPSCAWCVVTMPAHLPLSHPSC